MGIKTNNLIKILITMAWMKIEIQKEITKTFQAEVLLCCDVTYVRGNEIVLIKE